MTAGISPETLAAAVSVRDLRQIAAELAMHHTPEDEQVNMAERLEAIADRVDRLTGEAGKRIQNTVADIPDSELVRRALMNASTRPDLEPRWVQVTRTFGLGSTYSQQLCVRFGLSPDEKIGIDFDEAVPDAEDEPTDED